MSSLQIVMGQVETGVGVNRWAGQVVDGGQPAVIHKPGKNGLPWKYAPPRTSTLEEPSVLLDMLLSDWRAAEAHAT